MRQKEARKMRLRVWLTAGLAISAVSTASAVQNTLFLAHYDRIDDPHPQKLNADYAVGNPAVQGANGTIDPVARFGAGSLDPSSDVAGTVAYETAGNFNLTEGTVEMFVKTDNWADGTFRGLFAIWAGSSTEGDIRLQKTSGNQLQAYFTPNTGGVWSLTSSALNLDADWHHIAWTWNIAANTAALYVDGVVVDNTVDGTLTPFNGTLNATFQIGSIQSAAPSLQWDGLIDEVRISDIDRYQGQNFTVPTAAFVPEPATLVLLIGGALGIRRRRCGAASGT